MIPNPTRRNLQDALQPNSCSVSDPDTVELDEDDEDDEDDEG
ncbi:hypothetical protein AB0I94_28450 [Streptomyces sp. NPDC050147]